MPEEPVGYVDLTLKYEFEEDQWVGVCLELSTSTFGDTLEEVKDDLTQLVIEHLNLLEDASERERFFEEHVHEGWQQGATLDCQRYQQDYSIDNFGQILSKKQTGLGHAGLRKILDGDS